MRVFTGFEHLPPLEGTAMSVGVFDGVHLGHQRLLKKVIEEAERLGCPSVVMTFDPHPREVLFPGDSLVFLSSISKRLQLLESLGVELCFLMNFDRSFASQSPQQFIGDLLVTQLKMKALVIGTNFRFGSQALGNSDLLKDLAQKHHFSLTSIEPMMIHGTTVSSTHIRDLVLAGDIQEASQYLGRPYSIDGEVIQGQGLGRQIDLPTANIDYRLQALPPNGIYAAKVLYKGSIYGGALNIGFRPTVGASSQRVLEVHILDFHDNIYGEHLEIVFLEKIREERKFQDLKALSEQIHRDIETTKKILVAQRDLT